MAELTFRKGTDTTTDEDGNEVPSGEIVLKGDDIVSAKGGIVSQEGKEIEYGVSLELSKSGTEKFADATSELAGSSTPISIWMDNTLISAPTVNSAITDGKAQITGNFDLESATKLANQINSGALPLQTPRLCGCYRSLRTGRRFYRSYHRMVRIRSRLNTYYPGYRRYHTCSRYGR